MGWCTIYMYIRGITMISSKRSIIDEIRDEIQLDDYYRRFDEKKSNGDDFFDIVQSEHDYVFESFTNN